MKPLVVLIFSVLVSIQSSAAPGDDLACKYHPSKTFDSFATTSPSDRAAKQALGTHKNRCKTVKPEQLNQYFQQAQDACASKCGSVKRPEATVPVFFEIEVRDCRSRCANAQWSSVAAANAFFEGYNANTCEKTTSAAQAPAAGAARSQ